MRVKFFFVISCIISSAVAGEMNCAETKTDVERIVCSDQDLIESDRIVSELLTKAKELNLPIAEDQQRWKNERDQCLDAKCIAQQYLNRMESMEYAIELAKRNVVDTKISVAQNNSAPSPPPSSDTASTQANPSSSSDESNDWIWYAIAILLVGYLPGRWETKRQMNACPNCHKKAAARVDRTRVIMSDRSTRTAPTTTSTERYNKKGIRTGSSVSTGSRREAVTNALTEFNFSCRYCDHQWAKRYNVTNGGLPWHIPND